MAKIVVVGGGYAGVLAAIRAARRVGSGGEVALVSASDALIERIRLHQAAAGGWDPRRPLAALLHGTGVKLVHAACEAVDLEARTIECGGARIGFDRLIVAIGGAIDRDAIPGARQHARAIEIGDASAIHAALEALPDGARVVIVGGGLTGIETATEIAELRTRLRVALVTGGSLGERLSRGAIAHVRRALARLRIDLREGARVDRIEAGAIVIEGERAECHLAIAAFGFRAPSVLGEWGLPLSADGRARVDACLRVPGVPYVYVAGDCAAIEGALGSPVPAGCKTAMPMGAHAAENAIASLGGAPERPFDWADTAWCTSLGRRDGIVQSIGLDGRPHEGLFLTGYAAAVVKEMINRYTVKSLEWERDRTLEYRFRRARLRAPGLPDARADRAA